MKVFRFFILSAFLFSIFGCSVQFNQSNSNTNSAKPENGNVPKIEPTANKSAENKAKNSEPKQTKTTDNSTCYNLKRDDLLLDKKQTFAIDFGAV